MRKTLAIILASAALVAASTGAASAATGSDPSTASSTIQASGPNPPTHCC